MKKITFTSLNNHTKKPKYWQRLLVLGVIFLGGQSAFAQFPAPYCNINGNAGVQEITKVEFDNLVIPNANDTDILIDYTSEISDVTVEQTYTLTVQGNTYGNYANEFVAFIDWNNDGSWDNDDETYVFTDPIINSNGEDSQSTSIEITVPENAVAGETRIRITKTRTDSFNQLNIDPCSIKNAFFGSSQNAPGQAIDFTLNILPLCGDIPTPTGDGEQTLNEGETLANLIIEGEEDAEFTWYSDENLENEISADTEAEDGATYYVVQTIGDCTSEEALAITVTIAASTDNFDMQAFKVYPNPVKDILTVSYKESISEITVINMLGQTVINKPVHTNAIQLDMSALTKGNYILKVYINGAVHALKISK